MHVRQKFVHVHISKELKQKLGIKKRTAQIHSGDTVKIMVGKNKGKAGKVSSVNMKLGTLTIEGIVKKNAKGKELQIPIRTSNVYITEINAEDKIRKQILGIKQ
jgi:ribosomal protein uL24